jgi:hypothetical protein
MLFSETAKIQIGKNIAQEDKSLETNGLQESQGRARPAHLRTKVQIGDNYRVKAISLHAPYL